MEPHAGGERGPFGCAGEMAARCAAFDWAATPLGPAEGWSAGLRAAVALMLRTRFPMCLSWGPELVLVYNDAFIATLGGKHPVALGAPIAEVFAEIWDEVGHLQREVLATGVATYARELRLVLERGAGPEETFYTFSYSHAPDGPDAGPGSGGVLSVVTDTTRAVVGARRMGLLHALAGASPEVACLTDAVGASMRGLVGADLDLHHGACYLPGDADHLELVGAFGRGPRWPLTVASRDEGLVARVNDTGEAVAEVIPAAGDGPRVRVALPLCTGSPDQGVLVLAPQPLRHLDGEHEQFLSLVADHVGQLLTLAGVRADEQRRLAALASADRAKTALLSNVSHEFRTPLTLLLGPLEDALVHGVGTLQADDVAAMHQSTHRLLRMVDALLDAGRLDAAPRAAACEPTDVARLSEDLLAPLAHAADRRGLTLRARVDPTIGIVELDPALWETIVLNLVANALKYTDEGCVDVRLTGDGARLTLTVQDTGIGIADHEQRRVFDRFQRVAPPAGRHAEGTGLGLALVADAARAHGGDVRLDSTPGVGSTFAVRIPLVLAGSRGGARSSGEGSNGAGTNGAGTTDARAAAALAEHLAPVGGLVGPGVVDDPGPDAAPVIVVAEDDPGMRVRLARVLADLGPVVVCADGVEALDLLRRRSVALVVTDVMMPRLDGVGLLRAIRADDALAITPVVLLSARAGTEATTEALETGADDYVVKPFTRGELVARCRTTMELASLRASRSAEAARATMLAGVSHDMQTPLSVVSAVLEMLGDRSLDADLRLELAQRGSSRAAQLAQLVAQFLDWSRLAAGVEIAPTAERVDLAEMLVRVAGQHEGTRLEASALVARDVLCDRARTERIVHNLLDNAHAAARDVVSVAVEDGADGAGIAEVHVVDDGRGVDDRVLPCLFKAFGPSGRISGSGLGLHVSRAAARAQGGDLVLASTGGSGSRFVLVLPGES